MEIFDLTDSKQADIVAFLALNDDNAKFSDITDQRVAVESDEIERAKAVVEKINEKAKLEEKCEELDEEIAQHLS